ncbi:MAG TPA: hypothetical protein DEA46_05315, partial [Candidatus Moranbacteria bacterium]|nr:hypothetical protein [Candidatus Moranbacteria bacterium]
AILVIIHSLVFGVNMITLVIAFGFFVVFKKKFEKSFFLTILCYLSVDTLVILSNIDSLLSSYLVSIGKGIFTSAKFYSITGVFVLTYFYVIIERYLYDVFESKFLKKYGALLFLFFILIFSIFMFKRHNVNFLEYAIGPLLAIFFIGVLLFKKTFKELLLVSILCIILISVTVLLADECQMISKEKTSCFKFFLIDSF